jgi:hypothetical protein
MTMVPVALAAELAFFAFLGNRDTVNPLIDRPVIDDTVVSVRPAIYSHQDTGEVVRPTASVTGEADAKLDSAARADSIARAAGKPVAAARPGRVVPAGLQQYAVVAAFDPRVAVIWATRGDTL